MRENMPDIVKEMKEQERIGMLNCKIQDLYEEQEMMEETSDNVSDETILKEKNFSELIINSLPGIFYILNSSGGFVKWNKNFETISGYSAEELLKMNVIDCIAVEDKKLVSERIGETFLSGKSQVEAYFLSKNGSKTPYHLNGSIIIRDDVSYLVGLGIDTSERKKNEEEIMKLALVVKHSSELVNLGTLDGKMTFINEAGSEMLGIKPDEVQNYNVSDVIPEDLQLKVKDEVLPSILNNGKWEGELQYKNIKTGKIIDVYAQTFMIKDSVSNEPLYLANVSLDISEMKLSELELKNAYEKLSKFNVELEQLVQNKTEEITCQNEELISTNQELTATNEELTASNEELSATQQELTENIDTVKKLVGQKDDFIHMLGHDLKNPMTPIFTLLPIVEKKIQDTDSKKIVQVVINSAHKMKEIIDETLKLARLDDIGRTIELVDICLFDEITSIIEDNQNLFEDNEFIVENKVDTNLHALVDKFQFGELINNFITNAIKYTPGDKKGFLKIDAMVKDDIVEVSFCDNGFGMTEEQIGHVFDKFYKAGTPRKGMNSSGLGLAICENIVNKHGGRIWVESEGPDKGSTFYFTLKLNSKKEG